MLTESQNHGMVGVGSDLCGSKNQQIGKEAVWLFNLHSFQLFSAVLLEDEREAPQRIVLLLRAAFSKLLWAGSS